MKHELTMNEIAKFQKEYEQKPQNRVAELAVVNNGVAKASLDSEKVRKLNRTFQLKSQLIMLLIKSNRVAAGYLRP